MNINDLLETLYLSQYIWISDRGDTVYEGNLDDLNYHLIRIYGKEKVTRINTYVDKEKGVVVAIQLGLINREEH